MTLSARGLRLALAVTLLLGSTIVEATPSNAAATTGTGQAAITVISKTTLSPRLLDYTLDTPLLPDPVGVRVLLPTGYSTARRYPVLYLLHGGNGNYRDWTDDGNAEALTTGYPLIVVMPDASLYPSYANWSQPDAAGFRPQWETFHTDALVHWVDATFAALPTRAGRAIAGVSVGGFGAFSYAARHPDLYVDAASFSGQLDSNGDQVLRQIASQLDNGNFFTPYYGPRTTEEVIWRGHNPVDLAANLRGVALQLWTGNGLPGPLDRPFTLPDILEITVHGESISMHAALDQLGIPSEWNDYGPGTHNWPYWQRDLSQYLPQLMKIFAQHQPAPISFDYRSIDRSYGVYGWQVAITRPADEFSELSVRGDDTITLTGSGTAMIHTPDDYVSNKRYSVVIHDSAGATTQRMQANRAGSLTIPVTLGASATCQEYTLACDTITHVARISVQN